MMIMDLRLMSRVVLGLLVGVMFCGVTVGAEKGKGDGRPNIILIMSDDMGFSDIGCYGGEVKTPNIDRLAKEGLRFKQFYNNAKCTTTRASLLTGLYPRNGGRGITLLNNKMVTIAEALKPAGYHTGLFGKWHLGSKKPHRPIDRGFDTFYGLMDGCCNFFDPSQPDPKFKGGRVRVFGHDDKIITEFPEDFYTTDAFTDHAVKSIKKFAGKGEPFFVHVTYTAPHYPLHAKPEDIAKYKGLYKKIGWEKLRAQRYKRMVEMGIIDPKWKLPARELERSVGKWADAKDKDWEDLRMAVYAAMIDSMDQNIGRILETLDTLKIADNTIVMFLSDNGGCAETPGGNNTSYVPGPKEFYTHCGPAWAWAQNTPFRRYKSWVHEGGIATPLVVRWPGVVKANTFTNEVGHIIDFMPTFLEVGKAEYPSSYKGEAIIPVEGLSLVSVLKGEKREGHKQLFWHWAGTRAVREGDHKLVYDKRHKQWELYHMVKDRTEMNDLAEAQPKRVEKMKKAWEDWAVETGVIREKNGK